MQSQQSFLKEMKARNKELYRTFMIQKFLQCALIIVLGLAVGFGTFLVLTLLTK